MARHIRIIHNLLTPLHPQVAFNAPLVFPTNTEQGFVTLTAAGKQMASDPQVLENFLQSLAENDLTENE